MCITPKFSEAIPLSIYIHLPWCVRKCPYCDFNSHPLRGELAERDYIAALLRDLEHDLPRVWGRRVDTVFIGGGTPSLFSARALDELLSGLRARIPLRPDAEITLEANPGTLEQGNFSEFRAIGINRLSIGIQSFNPEHLQALGRIHDRSSAIKAAEAAHTAGFSRFNLDLMFGLPQQTPAQALDYIRTALALAPSHISYYQLTLEPNTLFERYPPKLPDDDSISDMQEQAQQQLAGAGYQQYEVSAYAQPGERCQHNLNYWQFGDYLGLGAGAHGKLSDSATSSITRLWKVKHPTDYLRHAGTAASLGGVETLEPSALGFEFMLNALRLVDGVEAELFEQRTGLPLTVIEPQLRQARADGLLVDDVRRIAPSALGLRFLNNLLERFLSH